MYTFLAGHDCEGDIDYWSVLMDPTRCYNADENFFLLNPACGKVVEKTYSNISNISVFELFLWKFSFDNRCAIFLSHLHICKICQSVLMVPSASSAVYMFQHPLNV